MAEHKVSGTDILLFLSRDNITFNTVICLTSVSTTRSTDIIDAKSKCGPDKLPGPQDNGVTFEGQVMEDPTSGKISTDELIDFWENKTTIYWKVGKAIPLIGDETDYGTGFIAKLDKVAGLADPQTFSGEIGVYGLMSKTTATS